MPLVVGVNKYSHDTSVCIARRDTGETLLIWSKERLSRRKHDGGDTAELLEVSTTPAMPRGIAPCCEPDTHSAQTALESIGRDLEDVELVVSNNHHFRVLPYEANPAQLAWSAPTSAPPAPCARRSPPFPSPWLPPVLAASAARCRDLCKRKRFVQLHGSASFTLSRDGRALAGLPRSAT